MAKKKQKFKEQLPIKDLHEKINYIIDRFDFQRVHTAMTALDWKWQHMNDPVDQTHRVPSIERMKHTATQLLISAGTQKERVFGTGGFQAERYKDESLNLQFIVFETCTFDRFD